jgi:hypothetical protein
MWLKPLYRQLKWAYLYMITKGRVNETVTVKPAEIIYGQNPNSQFIAKKCLGVVTGGNWDRDVLPVESHLLYQSYKKHFIDGEPWNTTPFYEFAVKTIQSGVPFRDEYTTIQSLNDRFKKCDNLYSRIREQGFKSNHKLYEEGIIDNKLELLDEVTVNVARDGSYILNDGWHRFTTARLLNVNTITVRVCAIHKDSISSI